MWNFLDNFYWALLLNDIRFIKSNRYMNYFFNLANDNFGNRNGYTLNLLLIQRLLYNFYYFFRDFFSINNISSFGYLHYIHKLLNF